MIKKNIVVIPAIKPKDKNLDKFGGWTWMENSIKSWQYWCDKNNYKLVIYDEPSISDLTKYRITVQRWFDIFNFLDNNGIEYDKIAMIDASSIPRWDLPDFFELADDRMVVGREMDNLRWVYESVQGYKDFFDGFELNISKYFCCQFVIFNKSHRDFFVKFKEKYLDNIEELTSLYKSIKRGTDQTPFNYMVQMNDIELKFLPFEYRISHLSRKELLNHNWQLNEDTTPFFIKYAKLWFFSGFDKRIRNDLMIQTWDMIKHNYTFDKTEILLNSVNHKNTHKNATSRKFKKDIIEFFGDEKFKDMSAVEFGSCHGDTTKIFCDLFKKVHAVDWRDSNIEVVKEKCKEYSNITYRVMDVVNDEWKNLPKADVVFIDASHDYPQVGYDIEKVIEYFGNPIIVMDDYGNSVNKNVRKAIDDKIKEGKLKLYKKIGENVGYKTKSGWEMDDREGIICNV
jgi:hypothetical protein